MRIIVKDLLPGKTYNLQFRSKNTGEVSVWGPTHPITISTQASKPIAPAGVTLASVGDSFKATWDRVIHSEDGSLATDLTGYVVQFRNVITGQTASFETTDTMFELTFNLNFAAFTPIAGQVGVRVAAKNSLGAQSAWSTEAIAQNPPPGPVRNLVAASGLDSVTATWEPPANLEGDFKEYLAYIGTSSNFTPANSNLIWRGVGTNATYTTTTQADHFFKVVAVDKFEGLSTVVTSNGVRPRSSVVVDVDAPDVPTNLNGSIAGQRLTVTWTAPANPDNDLAGYQIGYRPVGATGWSYATASHEDTSVIIEPITRFVNYEIKIQAHDFSFNYSPWSVNKTVNGEVNTAPAVPTGLQVKGAITSAMVVWNANTEDDLAGYEVQFKADSAPVDDDPTFPTTGRAISFSENVTQDTLYYARVRAVDTQGLKSAWSAPASDSVGFVDISEAIDPINTLLNNWQAGSGTTYINGGIILADSIGAGKIKTEEIAADSAFLSALTVDNANISSLEANKLTAGSGIVNSMTVKSTLTLGDASTNGVIQSQGFSGTTAGFKLDKSGVVINQGTVEARTLKIQSGQNIVPIAYADFEFPSSYYATALTTSAANATITTSSPRYNKQSLSVRSTNAAASEVFLGETNTDYNVALEEGTYIVSYWVRGGPVASNFQFRFRYSDGVYGTFAGSRTIAANAAWTRYSFTYAVPSGKTGGIISLYSSTATTNAGWDIDGIQIERQTGALTTPSAWSPGSGFTTIDGSIIRTGEIRSNTTVSLPGAGVQPMWSINMNGNMQINSAVIRGNLTVGGGASDSGAIIQSHNYVPGTSGFMMRGSDGYAEFRNLASNIIGVDQIKAGVLKADNIEAGTLNVNMDIGVNGAITVGSASEGVTTIEGGSTGGLKYYVPGVDDPVSEFGRNWISRADDGSTLASVLSDGSVSGRYGEFKELKVNGIDVMEQISGAAGVAMIDEPATWQSPVYSSETYYRNIGFTVKKGHIYRIENWLNILNVATSAGSFFAYLRYSDSTSGTPSSMPSMSGDAAASADTQISASAEGRFNMAFFYIADADKFVRVGVSARAGGGRSFRFFKSVFAVTDMGLYEPIGSQGAWNYNGDTPKVPVRKRIQIPAYKVYNNGVAAADQSRMLIGKTGNDTFTFGLQNPIYFEAFGAELKYVWLRLTNIGTQRVALSAGLADGSTLPNSYSGVNFTFLDALAPGATKWIQLPSSIVNGLAQDGVVGGSVQSLIIRGSGVNDNYSELAKPDAEQGIRAEFEILMRK